MKVYVFPDTLTKVAPGMVTVLTAVLSVTSAVIVIVSFGLLVVTLAFLETDTLEMEGGELSVFVTVMVSFTVAPFPAVSWA